MAQTKCVFGLDPNSPVVGNKDLGFEPVGRWQEGGVEGAQETGPGEAPTPPPSCVFLQSLVSWGDGGDHDSPVGFENCSAACLT